MLDTMQGPAHPPLQVVCGHEHYSGFSGGHPIQSVEQATEGDAAEALVGRLHCREEGATLTGGAGTSQPLLAAAPPSL